jgi:hypothetical protein
VLNKKTDLEKTIEKIKSHHQESPPTHPHLDPHPELLVGGEEFRRVLLERKKLIEDDQKIINETEIDEFRQIHRKILK